ncbi:MAG TPA: DUF3168 domain-containing protein [Sphingomicrobium sp.]|nr:DUF3168 domain-containing protein [Sphingomicrobium sp.]
MSAGGALQTAIAAALTMVEGLTGVFDGPPARAAYPYAALDATTETDWSHKSGEGRDVLVAITLWDDQPVRLHALADDIEANLRTLGPTAGWQLVTMRLVRRRVVRDVAGPWAAAIDFRARMLALS